MTNIQTKKIIINNKNKKTRKKNQLKIINKNNKGKVKKSIIKNINRNKNGYNAKMLEKLFLYKDLRNFLCTYNVQVKVTFSLINKKN